MIDDKADWKEWYLDGKFESGIAPLSLARFGGMLDPGFNIYSDQASEQTPIAGGGEFLVNTEIAGYQDRSVITALVDGSFVVTWESLGQDGSGEGIYSQLFNANGTALGGEFQVNTYSTNNQRYPFATALADGGFVITWTSYGQDADGENIYGQRFDSTGTAQGSEFLVNTFTAGGQYVASVTGLADGGFVVTWSSDGQDGSGYGIYGQRFDANGIAQGSEFPVNTYTTDSQNFPSATALADGGFVVTWSSDGQDGGSYGIYGQRFDGSGTALGSEFQVNATTANIQIYQAVAGLADGGFVVTWHSSNGSVYNVYGQRFDASGTAQGTEFQVNTYATNSQQYSAVTALSDGGFVVTWLSYGQDGSGSGVYGQRFDDSGIAIGGEFLINETAAGDQTQANVPNHSVTELADGTLAVTWYGNGTGDTDGVFARLFEVPINPTPVPDGGEFLVNTYTTNVQDDSAITALAGGGFVVTWTSTNQDGSGGGIYGQRYDASGTSVGSEFLINTETGNAQIFSSVIALTGGGFVVTWSSNGQDGGFYGVYGQRYDASGIAQGSEFQINTTTSGSQYYSSVAGLSNGGFVVSWTDAGGLDGNGNGIFGQRYDASGVAQGGEFQVNTHTIGQQDLSSVTGLADGGFLVTWSSAYQDGGTQGTYGQRYDASGVAQGGEFLINTETALYQWYPSVTDLADGGFVVTWSSYQQDGDQYGIYGQRFDASGTAQGSEFQVNSFTTGQQYYSSVTALSDGGFLVTWTSSGANQDGSSDGVYGQRFDADGISVGSEFLINETVNGTQQQSVSPRHSVTELADGTLAVTWYGSGTGDTSGVFARLFSVPDIVDDPAIAVDDAFATDEASALTTGNVFDANSAIADSDPDSPLMVTSVNGNAADVGVEIILVSGALLTLNSDGTFTYDPNGAFDYIPGAASGASNLTDTDSFTYQLNGDSTATVTITLSGLDSEDLLIGTAGADTLTGGVGNDTIEGLGGDDRLEGGQNDDTLRGGDDDDLLIGGNGDDTLEGGAGNDDLRGDSGSDTMRGGAGDDKIFGSAGADVLDGGDDYDVLYYQFSTDGVIASLATGLGSAGEAAGDTINGFEGMTGSQFADTLTGDGNDNFLAGNDGDDTLNGGGGHDAIFGDKGADRIFGGSGNDTLRGGAGEDEMHGELGDDIYFVDNAGDTVTELSGEGRDLVYTSIDFDAAGAEIEVISARSDSGLTLTASDIDTILRGGAGDEVLNGGIGNDMLFGGPGADSMTGGDGDDRYFLDDVGDTVAELAEEGRDIVYTSVDFDAGDSEIEVLRARSDSGLTLTASDTGTSIAGRNGDDTLVGAAGRDTLQGGLGTDILSGGADRDIFLFDDGDSAAEIADADHILDFSQGDGDRIDVKRIDAIDGGGDDAFSFIGTDAFNNVAGELRYEQVGGETHVFGDTDGNGVADFAIVLDSNVALVAADFTL